MKLRIKLLLCLILVILLAHGTIRNNKKLVSKYATAFTYRIYEYPDHAVYFLNANTTTTFIPPTKAMKLFCVAWSINTDEWWTHNPEWDVAEENDLVTCFRNTNDTLWKRLYDNQFRHDCDTQVYTRHMWSSGFGTDMDNVALSLLKAMHQKTPLAMTFVGKPWWHYSANKADGSNATCPARDMSCYFLPLTNCKPNKKKIDKDGIRMVRKFYKDLLGTYRFATRQQQWLRKEVYDLSKPLMSKLSNSCSVVHVRRADVILHGSQARKYFPLSDYVQLLPNKTHTVLLLTDDANAIDEAREFHPDIRWVYLDRPRHRGASGGWEEQVPSKDPKREVVTILAIMKLVAQCQVLIHSRSTFADALSRAMRPDIHKFQVDFNMSDVIHANNSISAESLQQMLAQKRKDLKFEKLPNMPSLK